MQELPDHVRSSHRDWFSVSAISSQRMMAPMIPGRSCQTGLSVPLDVVLNLRELAATRVRYGYRRLHILLRREGWQVNAKRVYRLYREET